MDGGKNLDSEPQFVNPVDPVDAPSTSGDLRLQPNSPAINSGDNQYVTGLSTDLDSNPRISGSVVDMGAYESKFYTLTVSLEETGSGSITANSISCGSDCTESYAYGTVVTLTANANTDSSFIGWSESGCGSTDDCAVTMETTKVVTANFELSDHQVFLPLILRNH